MGGYKSKITFQGPLKMVCPLNKAITTHALCYICEVLLAGPLKQILKNLGIHYVNVCLEMLSGRVYHWTHFLSDSGGQLSLLE